MTADERGLLAAVLESPDDDTPRLILADWYEENRRGVRARFIRTQIELARLVAADQLDSDEYVVAMRAVAQVPDIAFWDGVRRAGFPLEAGLQHPVDVLPHQVLVRDMAGRVSYIYRRGFIEHVLAPAGWFSRHDSAFAALPVRRIELALVGIAHQMQLRFTPPDAPSAGWLGECTVNWLSNVERYHRHWPSRRQMGNDLRRWLHELWTVRVPTAFPELVDVWRRMYGPHPENLFAPPPS